MWLGGSNPSFSALLDIWDIGVTTATLGFDPKRRGLTPLYPSNFTGDLRCGNRYLRGVRLVNSSYGNKPKEFESLRLTNY